MSNGPAGSATERIAPAGWEWKRILPGLLVSALALAAVLYFVDLGRFLLALQQADYRLVALFFSTGLVWLLVRAFFWRTLLQDKATFSQVFFTLNEGYLLNNVLPFRLGELGRAFLLSRKASLPFFEVFSTIFVERALDLGMAAALLLISLSFVVGAGWAEEGALVVAGVVVGGIFCLYLLARRQEQAIALFERLTHRWPALNRSGRRQFSAFLSGLAVFRQGRLFLRAMFWMLLNWLVAIGQYAILLRAFFPAIRWYWAPFTLGVGALGGAAPSSPGAIGVLEASIVGALAVFGLDSSVALAVAITSHLSSYLITGILGSFALARDGLTLTGLYRNVQQIEPAGADLAPASAGQLAQPPDPVRAGSAPASGEGPPD